MASRSDRRGLFIVLEGIDGSGTTTQAKLLADWLAAQGRSVTLTREPTTRRVGRLIRDAIRADADALDESVFALLFAADRVDHLRGEILPAIEAGDDVVSDRYVLSSLAYQSARLELAWVGELNRHAVPPDLTAVLNAPTELCLRRLRSAGRGGERYENPQLLEQIRLNYLRIASTLVAEGQRVQVLDATANVGELHDQVVQSVEPLLED